MPTSTLYVAAGVGLLTIGLWGVIAGLGALRRILAVNIMGSGVYLLLVAPATRHGLDAPDPVPHAMVLTGIVVAVSATALALALTRRITAERRTAGHE
jgi:multicomponent Na+:H+ antiporter subunit C